MPSSSPVLPSPLLPSPARVCRSRRWTCIPHAKHEEVASFGDVIGAFEPAPDHFGTKVQQKRGLDLASMHIVVAAAREAGLLASRLPVLVPR
jgi:hypothetical protein